jgi:hypothetical protein
VTLWERLANRQKEERVKAEIENEKLREMLDGQLRIARSLEKVLRKRAASSSVRAWILAGLCVLEADDTQCLTCLWQLKLMDPMAASLLKRRRPEAGDSSDNSSDSIFSMLSDDLDDVFTSFDEVMRQTNLGTLQDEINDAQAKLDAAGDLYMQLRHAAVVPFGVQRTGDAMWRFLSMNEQEIPNGYMKVHWCHVLLVSLEFPPV